MAASLTIKGLDQLDRNVRRLLGIAAPDGSLRAAKAGAEVLQEEWKGLVPVLEGNYRDSITIVEQGADAAVTVGPVPGVPANEQPILYAAKLEFTGHAAFRPALDASGARISDAMGDEVAAMIEEAI